METYYLLAETPKGSGDFRYTGQTISAPNGDDADRQRVAIQAADVAGNLYAVTTQAPE